MKIKKVIKAGSGNQSSTGVGKHIGIRIIRKTAKDAAPTARSVQQIYASEEEDIRRIKSSVGGLSDAKFAEKYKRFEAAKK